MNAEEIMRALLAGKVCERQVGPEDKESARRFKLMGGKFVSRRCGRDWSPRGAWELNAGTWRIVERKPAPATLAEGLTAYPASEGHWHKRAGWTSVSAAWPTDLEATDWLVSTDGGESWFSVNGEIDE